MPKQAKIIIGKNADIYDLRMAFEVGDSLAVSLPCHNAPKQGTIMRCISKEGIFIYLPEIVYKNSEQIRILIEKFFSYPFTSETI